MNSPFPGLDPYLERHWGDVHASLMVYGSNQLNSQLPDDLQARIEESLSPGIGDDQNRMRDESPTARHIQITEGDDERVITAIEVLSPSNKTTRKGRNAYQAKQEEYLDSEANLVEIDLIRSGSFVLAAPWTLLPEEYENCSLICIRRAAQPDRIELYRAPLRERLPNIPIPLRAQDRDVVLQLQPLIDACYQDGRYSRTDYRREPTPPLSESDADWADTLLRTASLR